MAFANFSLTTAYTAIITALNTQLTAVAGMFKDQTTGDFVGQIRVSSTGKRLESWSGSAWVALDLSSTAITTATNSTNATTAVNATTHIADVAGAVHGAVSTNTANMIVRRDASGNFSAGTMTGTATTATNALSLGGSLAALFAKLASPALTGTPTAPTATAGTNTTQIATTAFSAAEVAAAKVSPAFTGTPTAPTAAAGTNTTQLSTTAFAMTAASNAVAAVAVPSASETVAGKVELATAAEASLGLDTVRSITPSTMKAGLNAGGSAPIYACRAWVNFNGTGTVSIRSSGNVSSITDNANGDYTVNFTTAMPDSNYAVSIMGGDVWNGGAIWKVRSEGSSTGIPTVMTASAVRIVLATTTTAVDAYTSTLAIFR